jgi:beta-lactamase class A
MRETISLAITMIMIHLGTNSSAQNNEKKNILESKIKSIISKTEGRIAVAFKNLDNEETLFINEHEYYHAASTMKTPVMMEVFNQISQSKLQLTDSILVKNNFKSIVDGSAYSLSLSDDSDDILYKKVGSNMTVYQLVYEMITVSSNLATNLLIDKIGAENVMKHLNDLGISETLVLRGVEDQKAFDAALNNRTTAFGLLQIFEHLATNTKQNIAMRETLFAQKFNEIIPAKLPKTVKVAHKTGTITGVQHDSGIVFLPDGRKYVLVLLSKELKDVEASVENLAEISKLVYDYLN